MPKPNEPVAESDVDTQSNLTDLVNAPSPGPSVLETGLPDGPNVAPGPWEENAARGEQPPSAG